MGELSELTKEIVISSTEKEPRRKLLIGDNVSAEVTTILLPRERCEFAEAHSESAAIEQIPTILPDIPLLNIGPTET